MKPNEKQKELISKISSEIKGWRNTNDIDSSSNWSLIEEFCESLELHNIKQNRLNNALDEIMTIIKQTR